MGGGEVGEAQAQHVQGAHQQGSCSTPVTFRPGKGNKEKEKEEINRMRR